MIAPAPAAAASAASAATWPGVDDDTPAITGTLPAAAAATVSTTVRRSVTDRLAASPIVPVATRPCTPPSSSARTLRSSATWSTAPGSSKGVVTAGMMPSKRMVVG